MFKEEAIWVEKALSKINPLLNNNLATNLGSSTSYFREVIQPHIHKHIIESLKYRNWHIVNVDIKQEEGVDVVADVTKSDFTGKVQKSALTICTNMLEHVEDIAFVIQNLLAITINGGYILITVPYKYRRHLDPIDNMFRPTPEEIVKLFPINKVEVIDKKIIVIHDKQYYSKKKSRFPIWGYREIIGFYFGKKHKVSGVLLKMLA